MKIKTAAQLANMTPRNIRFYEEMGLITTGRSENGYREYNDEDIERLRQIKMMRDLGITMENIKKYFSHKVSMNELMAERKKELETQRKEVETLYKLCDSLEHQQLPLSEYTTKLVSNAIEEKENIDKNNKILTSNIQQRFSRKAVILDLVVSIILFSLLAYFTSDNLFKVALSSKGVIVDPTKREMINLIVIIIVTLLCVVISIRGSKNEHFELRENGIYYINDETQKSYFECFKKMLQNKYNECMEFISYEAISAVKTGVQQEGMITGGDHVFSFYLVIFTKDDRAIRLNSQTFTGQEHFMLTLRILHDKAPKWIDPKNLAKILELPNKQAYEILNTYYWNKRPWHKTRFYQKYSRKSK